MNLQTIQKRVEELSAELITVSNDLAFLLQGEVKRETVVVFPRLTRFNQVASGDTLLFSEPFTDIDGDIFKAGAYKATDVEGSHYEGHWSVELSNPSGHDSWINFNQIAAVQLITKVG